MRLFSQWRAPNSAHRFPSHLRIIRTRKRIIWTCKWTNHIPSRANSFEESSSVESITCVTKGFVAALESGELIAKTPNSKPIWNAPGSKVSTQSAGFDDTHWCGRWDSNTGVVEVRDNKGKLVVTGKTTRPRVSDNSENRVGFGFEDGQILVWEKDYFQEESIKKQAKRILENLRSQRS